MRTLACEILEAQGYTLLPAESGPDALRIYADHGRPVDLVVTDVVMPQMSGPELVSRLKSMQAGLRCVYMSGYAQDATSLRGFLESGGAFVEKPFTPATLTSLVQRVLDSVL